MPLEATVMVIDNSEYMRNGDYQPTRFEAQADAVNVVFQTKTDSNPENTVGLMTSGGKCPEVLVTHTKDLGQILQGIHVARQKLSGSIDVPTAINIAQLALKHRENKNLRQRILVFVGSPIHEVPNTDSASMIKLAKKLKKNNVAVDVVCFGDGIEEEDEEGKTVLKSFVENVNSGDNSHLVCIPPDALLLSDALINSAVLAADRGALIPEELQVGGAGAGEGAGAGGAGAGGAGFEFGVDPSLDPELAMALRLSMQEAEARDAVANAGASSGAGAESAAVPPAAPEAAAGAAAAGAAADAQMDEDDDEEELRKALALSKGEGGDEDVEMDDEEDEDEDEDLDDDEEDGEGEDEDEDDEDEDAAIQRAIQMSMETQKDEESKGGKK
ncbi:hypothetical protein D9611_002959 [Ephemerocybe angulata]|uniref:VWFA domain-containing protein n=1 Tax=Ephemerocybe angulata TaxID=980116 RepID=A0A8H5FHT7_9AGAR|nr:hypothetical protein D9611_002959 [Tulosesus angulatus]